MGEEKEEGRRKSRVRGMQEKIEERKREKERDKRKRGRNAEGWGGKNEEWEETRKEE